MANYYMVALNKSGPRLIELNKEQLDEKDDNKLHSMEYIDYITSQYDETAFRRFLYNKGKIDNFYNPVYIVKYHLHKGTKVLKYYDLIFKSNYDNYMKFITLTTMRQRAIMYNDIPSLIKHFKRYMETDSFRDIYSYALNKNQIKHLNNLSPSNTKPLDYTTIRGIISSFYQYERLKYYGEYAINNYKKEDYSKAILKLIPKNVKEKYDRDLSEYSSEKLEEIRNSAWDNEAAKSVLSSSNSIDMEVYETLTLEDQLRIGKIDNLKFNSERIEKTAKFRK